jgi:hypothetical protein
MKLEDMGQFQLDALWALCPHPNHVDTAGHVAFLNLDGTVDVRRVDRGAPEWRVPVPPRVKFAPFVGEEMPSLRDLTIRERLFVRQELHSPRGQGYPPARRVVYVEQEPSR